MLSSLESGWKEFSEKVLEAFQEQGQIDEENRRQWIARQRQDTMDPPATYSGTDDNAEELETLIVEGGTFPQDDPEAAFPAAAPARALPLSGDQWVNVVEVALSTSDVSPIGDAVQRVGELVNRSDSDTFEACFSMSLKVPETDDRSDNDGDSVWIPFGEDVPGRVVLTSLFLSQATAGTQARDVPALELTLGRRRGLEFEPINIDWSALILAKDVSVRAGLLLLLDDVDLIVCLAHDDDSKNFITPEHTTSEHVFWPITPVTMCALLRYALDYRDAPMEAIINVLLNHDGRHYRIPNGYANAIIDHIGRLARRSPLSDYGLRVQTYNRSPVRRVLDENDISIELWCKHLK